MKKIWLICLLQITLLSFVVSQEKYDIVQYTFPEGWKVEDQASARVYSRIDGGSWGQIAIYKSTASKGNIQADAQSEWEKIVLPGRVIQQEETVPPQHSEGWSVAVRSGVWKFNGANVATILTTYSNGQVCVSILCNVTAQPYLPMYQSLVGSVSLDAGSAQTQGTGDPGGTSTAILQDRFKYNTTPFDDGWVSTVHADWVEVNKKDCKVIIHYPKEGTIIPADPPIVVTNAWDILVAPRYSNLRNFKSAYISNYFYLYLGMATVTDKTTGKTLFVVLFRGDRDWIECRMPDKNAFIQEFGFDPEKIDHNSEPKIADRLARMSNYNRFAVAASDLDNSGMWSDRFSSNTYYTNVYTGSSAGMSTYSSGQHYEFGKNQSYHWEIVAATSYGGSTSVQQAKKDGVFKMINEWKMQLTDTKDKPKNYDVYFTAVKGGRILWMNDADYPGSGIFTGFTPAK